MYKAEDVTVELPSGKSVTIGPLFGSMALAVDLEFADEPGPKQEWKWAEVLARRVKAIDGKPVAGKYTMQRLHTDFPDRDIRVMVHVIGAMDTPTPEEIAKALKGTGLVAGEALDESVELYRVSGGAVPFESAMEMPAKQRKLVLATFVGRVQGSEGPRGQAGAEGEDEG